MPSGLRRLIIGRPFRSAGLVIVRVVAGRYLHDARAECRVDQQAVGDDRDLAAGQSGRSTSLPIRCRYRESSGMNGHGRVAEHGLGPGRRDVQNLSRCRAGNRVLDRPEMPLGLFVVDLVVGDGGSKLRVPVDQPFAAKDFAGLEQIEKRAADRREQSSSSVNRVRSQSHEQPIMRSWLKIRFSYSSFHAQIRSTSALPAQVVPGFLFFFEQPLFDHGLGGDAGVVSPGHPQELRIPASAASGSGCLAACC